MSYLGNAPESVFTEMKYQDLTGGSGTSFTLNQAVSNPQEIEVFVNNVRQEPSASYSVSGTTLTMTESVGASEDFYVVFQGMAQGSATHPATQSLEAASVTSTGAISGTTITGTSFVSSGNMTFADNDKIVIGTGSDLEIYHDGSHSYISDQGTGQLRFLAENFQVRNAGNSSTMIYATPGGSVQLYHNNATKVETTSTGVSVTGTTEASVFKVGSGQYFDESSGNVRINNINNAAIVFSTGSSGDERARIMSDGLDFRNTTGTHYVLFKNGDGVHFGATQGSNTTSSVPCKYNHLKENSLFSFTHLPNTRPSR